VLVLDEPTSGLREAEVQRLLSTIRTLRDQGRSVVFITHRMSEMFEVCDLFTVMKDGESVASLVASETTSDEMIRLMVGRSLSALFPERVGVDAAAPAVLEVSGLTVPGTSVENASVSVRAGEIVGIAGLAGNGQTELLEGIAGVRSARGTVTVERGRGPFRGTRRAVAAGVVLVPEDRKRQGLILPFSIRWNLTLPNLRQVTRVGFVKRREEAAITEKSIMTLNIRPGDDRQIVSELSGGNQQKVVVGRSLIAEPRVLVLADPTRGIDVGTKQEIYTLLRQLTAEGRGVLMTSSELSETVGICDRVLVMSSGRIVAEFTGDDITEEAITDASFSGKAVAS